MPKNKIKDKVQKILDDNQYPYTEEGIAFHFRQIKKPIPALPLLQPPEPGYECGVCGHCVPLPSTMDSHISAKHGRDNARGSKSVFIQRAASNGSYKIYWSVLDPRMDRSSHTTDTSHACYISMFGPQLAKDRETEKAKKTEEMLKEECYHGLDIGSFMAKSGWHEFGKTMGLQTRRRLIVQAGPLCSRDPAYLSGVKGTGRQYLASLSARDSPHFAIMEKLTRWKSRRYVPSFTCFFVRVSKLTLRVIQYGICILVYSGGKGSVWKRPR